MNSQTITQRTSQLIKKLFVGFAVLTLLSSCQGNDKAQKKETSQAGVVLKNFKQYPIMKLATSSGKLLKVYKAMTVGEQTQGLSGVKKIS
jgi:hypothetical protein